jgi:CarD family transcriptional regulator
MTLFQVGEKVVYPTQGIGTIENISSRSFGTRFERFYLLRLTYTEMTVMVPFSHVEEIGLRKITRNGEVSRVLAFLAEGKMRNGSLLEIAEVLKILLILQSYKPLSFREKKMLQRTRHLLVTELSISRRLGEEGVISLLQEALSRASLTLPLPA